MVWVAGWLLVLVLVAWLGAGVWSAVLCVCDVFVCSQ